MDFLQQQGWGCNLELEMLSSALEGLDQNPAVLEPHSRVWQDYRLFLAEYCEDI